MISSVVLTQLPGLGLGSNAADLWAVETDPPRDLHVSYL